MPKPMYVWTGTAWVSVASEVESLATYATQSYADNTTGTRMIVPTSISVGSGSGSVATQGTVTFSGASSVSINGIFSSTYDNYVIRLNLSSSGGNILVRMRTSGSDVTGTSYTYQQFGGDNTTLSATRQTSQTSFKAGAQAGSRSSITLQLYGPYLAQETLMFSENSRNITSPDAFIFTGGNTNTTSYDSLTILDSSTTLSGNLRIYGYKNG